MALAGSAQVNRHVDAFADVDERGHGVCSHVAAHCDEV
jgi:hypothetical protein